MGIKVSIVESHILSDVKQYNIDEFHIKENFGTVNKFKKVLNGKRTKEQEAYLLSFLYEFNPNNIISDMRKNSKNLQIKEGFDNLQNHSIS